MARRWADVVRGSDLRFVVHVGSNCLADARRLAARAQRLGAALAPGNFKPQTLAALVACCAATAGAAPGVPFYFYSTNQSFRRRGAFDETCADKIRGGFLDRPDHDHDQLEEAA